MCIVGKWVWYWKKKAAEGVKGYVIGRKRVYDAVFSSQTFTIA